MLFDLTMLESGMFKKLVLLTVSMAIISGCATQQEAMTARDKVVVDNRLEELEATQTRLRTRVASLEKTVEQLEERLSLMSRRTTLDAREVVKIEPNSPISSSYAQRPTVIATPMADQDNYPDQDDVYQEIIISDDKKRAYFGSSKASSTSGTASSGPQRAYDNVVTGEHLPAMNTPSSAGTTTSAAPSQSVSASPMSFYQEGIDLYRRGMYVEGRARFEQFLATKPETEYIDNALYWIGECYYGQGLYHEAANYFHKIVQEYPKTSKVPDALLKVSLTYKQLGRNDSALEMLRYLMDAFPGSEAARIGKQKYEAWTQTQPST